MIPRKKPGSPYHHGDLRAALLENAWAMVTSDGLDSLSLRAVAQKAGVSYGAPAHHFANREALIAALREETWSRFGLALKEKQAEGLRAVGRAYIDFASEHPRQMELMFKAGSEETQSSRTAWEVLLNTVARELGPERVKDTDALFAASMAAWAAVQGFAVVARAPFVEDEKVRSALRERLLDMVLEGLLRTSRRAR